MEFVAAQITNGRGYWYEFPLNVPKSSMEKSALEAIAGVIMMIYLQSLKPTL